MDKLLKYIYDNLKEFKDNTYLKLVSVVYDKSSEVVTFRFIYQNVEVTKGLKQRVIDLIKAYYKNKFQIDVKMKKSFLDEDALQEFVYRFIKGNCKSMLDFDKKDISVKIEDKAIIYCNIEGRFCDFLNSKNITKQLVDNLNDNFFGEFEIVLIEKQVVKDTDILKEKELEIETMVQSTNSYLKPQFIEVEVFETFMGNIIEDNKAIEIGSIKKPQENIIICGKINYFLKKSFVSKKKDADGNGVEKEYFSFTLDDTTGKMQCVCFPNKDHFEAVGQLENGAEVVLFGSVEEFNGRINFKTKSMAFCKLPEIKEKEVELKSVNDKYYYIKPEPYINISQDNFFAEKKEPNEFLKQNEVVVFDIETTGLDYSKNEIIEIGAVKMKEGEIVETFSCFVKPKESIPDEIVNLTHITDEMVKDAYTIDKVIPDFYKFCYGCVIMAYNIDFDYKFINFQASKLGYKFDNRQVDAMYLARLNVVGAKNFKLKSICDKLGVSLEGAHRAINDTIATAEVIKLISHNVSPK